MVGHLGAFGVGFLTFDDLQAEVNKDFPVAARIEWSNGSAHFVVVTDCWISTTGAEVVTVADPLGWTADWLYVDFVNAYESIGVWTHTYLLRP